MHISIEFPPSRKSFSKFSHDRKKNTTTTKKTNKQKQIRNRVTVVVCWIEQAKILHFETDLVMIKSRKVELISKSTRKVHERIATQTLGIFVDLKSTQRLRL